MEEKYDELNEKMNKIIEKLDNDVIPYSRRMALHIEWIERIYEYVKAPLGFICNKFYKIMGRETKYELDHEIKYDRLSY